MAKIIFSVFIIIIFMFYGISLTKAQTTDEPSEDNIETTIVNKGDAPLDEAQNRLKEADSSIKRMNEENILLRKVIKEIDTPLTGVEEIIRQEKMRMIFNRVNKNLNLIDKMRKEQERQYSIIKQQQAVLDQQRNLPKK